MREFNVTGLCVPSKHYMADTSEKLAKIMDLVEKGKYFTINRGRQYGKTTTLNLLEKQLPKEYAVIKTSFEGVSDGMFDTEAAFCQGLLYQCAKYFENKELPEAENWKDRSVTEFALLDKFLTRICLNKKYVLMIDEVDKTSNNFIFLKFLERECRLLFITYLRPYINGTGFYHLESETRDGERTDVIIDYNSEQFIVELKLWYGEAAYDDALEQIAGYLDSKNKDTGYLFTFDFRKTKNVGKPQIRWVEHKDKKIFDVMVGV